MQGGFFGTRLAGALGCCFEVEAGVKAIFQSEHGRGNRGVGDADLVGQNGVDALGSGGDLTADLKADELEVGGDVAELHLDAIFAEFLVEVDAFEGERCGLSGSPGGLLDLSVDVELCFIEAELAQVGGEYRIDGVRAEGTLAGVVLRVRGDG